MSAVVKGLVSDEGSIIVLEVEDEDGDTVHIGCDHRPARVILEALEDDNEVVEVEYESWQVVRRFRPDVKRREAFVKALEQDA